jgi:hypothetical protein
VSQVGEVPYGLASPTRQRHVAESAISLVTHRSALGASECLIDALYGTKLHLNGVAPACLPDLERLNIVLLELLVRYEADWTYEGIRAVPHRVPSYHPRYLGPESPDNPPFWTIGRRKWTASAICAARAQLRPVLTTLFGTLERHGLAAQNDTAPEVLKQLSEDLMQQVNQQAGQMQRGKQMKPITLKRPTIRDVEPNWSPTELGEKVLNYYQLAGEEEITDAAGSGQPEG